MNLEKEITLFTRPMNWSSRMETIETDLPWLCRTTTKRDQISIPVEYDSIYFPNMFRDGKP